MPRLSGAKGDWRMKNKTRSLQSRKIATAVAIWHQIFIGSHDPATTGLPWWVVVSHGPSRCIYQGWQGRHTLSAVLWVSVWARSLKERLSQIVSLFGIRMSALPGGVRQRKHLYALLSHFQLPVTSMKSLGKKKFRWEKVRKWRTLSLFLPPGIKSPFLPRAGVS